MTLRLTPHRPLARWGLVDVIRYFLPPLAAGVVAGVIACAGLLAADVGGLLGLMLRDPGGWIALVMLMSGFAVTFGSAPPSAAR